MIFDAAARPMDSDPAVHALADDAGNDAAAGFHRLSDFMPFEGQPARPFLPLATFREAQAR